MRISKTTVDTGQLEKHVEVIGNCSERRNVLTKEENKHML